MNTTRHDDAPVLQHPSARSDSSQRSPRGELLVVKVGGSQSLAFEEIAGDLERLAAAGRPIVLVHGGAETTNQIAEQLGHPPQFVTSVSGQVSRRTDRKTLEIFQMVYRGLLNQRWVELLQKRNLNAVGLSGLDGRLLSGRRKSRIRIRQGGRNLVLRDDWTGTVDRVNAPLLQGLLCEGYFPVITPPASSEKGEPINVDGDRAAGAIAAALGASDLVILSDVPGLLRNFPNEDSLIRTATLSQLEELSQVALGRMKKKVHGAGVALEGGVARVVLGDGRSAEPISAALRGEGTQILRRRSEPTQSVAPEHGLPALGESCR